jgi:hypothetical protein
VALEELLGDGVEVGGVDVDLAVVAEDEVVAGLVRPLEAGVDVGVGRVVDRGHDGLVASSELHRRGHSAARACGRACRRSRCLAEIPR